MWVVGIYRILVCTYNVVCNNNTISYQTASEYKHLVRRLKIWKSKRNIQLYVHYFD